MKILIAVDGSLFTRKAIDYLAAHRSMFVEGNELVVLNVCAGIPGHVARHIAKSTLDDYYAEESAKVLDPVRAILDGHGIDSYQVLARHGRTAEEIVHAAREAGAGLIVMGTHGHGTIGRALMGSVATKVIAEAEIAVLLVQ
ncbi:MAG: universal stress protein [Xenophilus sp.]